MKQYRTRRLPTMALRRRWTVLPLVLSLGPHPAVIAMPAQEMLLVARQADTSSDGSGSAPYRASPSFLLFALTSLLVGSLLLVAGKRLWRVTTALGAGLLLELLVWITIVNTMSDNGFASSTRTNDLVLWAIVTAGGIVGLAVGGFFWRVGMLAACICGGMSFGFSIAMMAKNDLPVVARRVWRRENGARKLTRRCLQVDHHWSTESRWTCRLSLHPEARRHGKSSPSSSTCSD